MLQKVKKAPLSTLGKLRTFEEVASSPAATGDGGSVAVFGGDSDLELPAQFTPNHLKALPQPPRRVEAVSGSQ